MRTIVTKLADQILFSTYRQLFPGTLFRIAHSCTWHIKAIFVNYWACCTGVWQGYLSSFYYYLILELEDVTITETLVITRLVSARLAEAENLDGRFVGVSQNIIKWFGMPYTLQQYSKVYFRMHLHILSWCNYHILINWLWGQ